MKTAFPVLATLMLAPLAALHADDQSEPKARPNFLFLITDQQTAGALGCAGNPYVKTPNMDALAARGMRFRKSYSTFPVCSPARASFFTSRMPHEVDIFANYDAELSTRGVQTMGGLFQAGGYKTAYAGKWHLQMPYPAYKNKDIPGFDILPLAGPDPGTLDLEQEGKGLNADPHVADASINFLGQEHDKPFLLVTSLLNPHDICEYGAQKCAALEKLLPDHPEMLPPVRPNWRDSEPLPSALQTRVEQRTERAWREYLWVYYRLVETVDAEVGRVLAALRQTGLADRTVVVFTSDHGEMMGSHGLRTKPKLYDEAAAVPLIVAAPGCRAGVDDQHLVSGLDIMPTLLDYAGLAVPASLEGRSLRPLVEGKTVSWRDFVVSEVSDAFQDSRMVRTDRYKYIVFAQGDHREQFFDMEKDPGELKNLIADPAVADEVVRHRKLLDKWQTETHDVFGRRPAVEKGRRGKKQGGDDLANKPAATGANPATDRRAMFEKRDANHDGKLSAEEFIARQRDAETAKTRFEKLNTDKDGFLSREEFIGR